MMQCNTLLSEHVSLQVRTALSHSQHLAGFDRRTETEMNQPTRNPRRRRVLALGAGLALTTPLLPVLAQAWPTRPIRMIVNFPAGGSADLFGRAVAAAISESLGQPVVVENRAGAGGNIGAAEVARAAPDGYTLLFSPGATLISNPFLFRAMPFDAERDLVPVASVARLTLLLLTHPVVPARSVAELVAHIRANPGRVSYGSPGVGTSPHLAAEMFLRQAGLQATHVPYRGAAPALTALLGGEVQFHFDAGPGLPHATAGRLRLLAVASPVRSAQVPDTPTLAESGFPGFDADTLFGVYLPSRTPPALVARLHEEVMRTLANPRVQEAIRGLGSEPLAMTQQAFVERMSADRARFGRFIQEAGIRVE
jgi:tripartite-type tricarboxylate transporter receptor subunit TctC